MGFNSGFKGLNLLDTSHTILQPIQYVVCKVQSTVLDTVPQFHDLRNFTQQILICLPLIGSVFVVIKLNTAFILYQGSIFFVLHLIKIIYQQ
jgi:hypothetical protein